MESETVQGLPYIKENTPPWSLKPEDLMRFLKTSIKGLSEEEAKKRLAVYGRNEIRERGRKSPLVIFLSQFTNPLVLLLMGAAVVSFAIGETIDAALIFLILFVNGVLGFYQEFKAEKAMEMLKSMMSRKARVIRDGVVKDVPAEEIVPGDIIVLEEGDIVPADARLVESHDLMVNESVLTGESVPVEKDWSSLHDPSTPAADRRNVVYSGTFVVRGRGIAVVYATGEGTEMGKIAGMVRREEEEKTTFDEEIESISRIIGGGIIVIALLTGSILLLAGYSILDAFLVAVALAVAAVPEGLPAVVTLSLSMGVLEMAKKKALVRKLKSVEVLGSVDVICTDKTGTITKNRLEVVEWMGDKRWLKIVAGCCNGARLGGKDPLDEALLRFANNVKCNVVDVIPFSSDRKMMSVVADINGKRYILTKGAPEVISKLVGDPVPEHVDRMMEKGLRVIGLAYKEGEDGVEEPPYKLAGYVALLDPPREGVREAIERAKEAGIKTIMITGDHPKTAKTVASMVGIEGKIITGRELENMSEEELGAIIEEVGVFARVDPSHKLKIVKALQKKGHVVAMTGDGVNDAPALKRADVGVALGSGTDLAKEVADIIILDDNYATIVRAVEEGRRIFENIKKFLVYLLSANMGEVTAVFGASILGKVILKPVHLLFLNVVTDGLPAVALATDPPKKDIMKRPPRKRGEPVIGKEELLKQVVLIGGFIGLAMLLVYFHALHWGLGVAWSVTLLTFTLLEMVRLQTVRGEPITSNRLLLWAVVSSILLTSIILYITPDLLSLQPPPIPLLILSLVITLVVWLVIKLINNFEEKEIV